MDDARRRLKRSFSSATAQWPHPKKTFTVMSPHINNNCAEKLGIGEKFLLTVRATMQEVHVDLVAGDFNGAAWRQSSGNTLNRLNATRPHHCGALVQFLATGPLSVASSNPELARYVEDSSTWDFYNSPRNLVSYSKRSESQQRSNGYTWTSSATEMLTCHEEIMSNVSCSRKGLAPTHLPKRKLGAMMKVTIRFHLCHRYENLCFHEQCV